MRGNGIIYTPETENRTFWIIMAVLIIGALIGVIVYYTDVKWQKENSLAQSMARGVGLGNEIALYAYQYLKAMRDGTTFTVNLPAFKKRFNSQKRNLLDVFPNAIQEQENLSANRSIRLADNSDEPLYTHDIDFFQSHRLLLRKTLGTNALGRNGYDVTVHLRLEDIDAYTGKGYTVLPRAYYTNVFETITGPRANVVIVCAKPDSPFNERALQECIDGVKACKEVKDVQVQSKSIKHDFETLLGASVLVLAVSTFSFWGAFLSIHCKEAHVPYFGIMANAVGDFPIRTEKWASTPQTTIVLHHSHVPQRSINKLEDFD